MGLFSVFLCGVCMCTEGLAVSFFLFFLIV